MSVFVCPKCHKALVKYENRLKCENNHSFDIAKSGYVNLLLSAKACHGDDKTMVDARRAFLDGGYYDRLVSRVSEVCNKYVVSNGVILDAGCGEGKYTNGIYNLTREKNAFVCGVDISKRAVDKAKKRNRNIDFAVAGINDLPVSDESIDILVNIFAPEFREEYLRVLKPSGCYIKVVPRENHLIQLKNAVYDEVYKTEIKEEVLEGFCKINSENITYNFNLNSNEMIQNLFTMTPYYYKTSKENAQKLLSYNSMEITAEFRLTVYKKTE